jgi:hypothetical protein
MLAVGLSNAPFLCWNIVLLFLVCSKPFLHECMMNFVKSFLVSIEIIMWFLPLILFMCCIMFIDLHVLNHPCIPGMKPIDHSVYYFNVLLNLVWEYLIEKICAHVHQENWSIIFFFVCGILIWFRYWLHRKSLVAFHPLLFYGIIWRSFLLILL